MVYLALVEINLFLLVKNRKKMMEESALQNPLKEKKKKDKIK